MSKFGKFGEPWAVSNNYYGQVLIHTGRFNEPWESPEWDGFRCSQDAEGREDSNESLDA